LLTPIGASPKMTAHGGVESSTDRIDRDVGFKGAGRKPGFFIWRASRQRTKREGAVETLRLAAVRADKFESLRQQPQGLFVIVRGIGFVNWIYRVVENGRAERGHMHSQLMFFSRDRRELVAPERIAALDDINNGFGVGQSGFLAHAKKRLTRN